MGSFFSGFHFYYSNQCQEVIPNLFIGRIGSITDVRTLSEHKITHVLDVSQRSYVREPNVCYLKIDVPDEETFDIRSIFPMTNAFIQRCLDRGGRCLVNCAWGVSRSASVVLAYLMFSQKWSLDQSIQHLKGKRPVVNPNAGFQKCLGIYEQELKR